MEEVTGSNPVPTTKNMFNTKYINKEIGNIKPSEQGWLWPEPDNYFLWFEETIPHYLNAYKACGKNFRVAVQAGGHCGIYPRMMATLYETVYTFEPDADSFHCLVNNCQLTNIKKLNATLGNIREPVYQTLKAGNNVGVNQFATQTKAPITKYVDINEREESALVNIPQIRIDDLGLTHCDLIHLDVEMSEDQAIAGAVETIKRCRPLLVLETVPTRQLDFFTSLGYQLIHAEHCGDTFFAC